MRSGLASRLCALVIPLVGFGALTALADNAPTTPTNGSPNTATADPPIAVPDTTPCVVPLFAGVTFADFSPKPFSFSPSCGASSWSKIVLAADFSVTAGRQFDRTASIWIGGANVYFGTTAEPSRTVSPSWHIENDVTELGALFTQDQAGLVQLDNLVNDTFTGVLSGRAELRFYPASRHAAPATIADVVIPLSNTATGGAVGLATTSDRLARTLSLPRNLERAYLDIYAQSQSGDEFWYTCVPDELADTLQSCGGAGFREAEVTVDGRPAGVAPIYPWIYTGGIDPSLWRPIPGVQTLDFAPYRVDLSPFAGALADGAPHEIAIHVFGANNFFATTANLLLYVDHRATHTGGAITDDTLAEPAPTTTSNITTGADGSVTGPVRVAAARHYRIAGYVDTSHGRVRTEVSGDVAFDNTQTFTITSALYHQLIHQHTSILQRVTRENRGARSDQITQQAWPLDVDFAFASNADGTAAQTTQIHQRLERTRTGFDRGFLVDFSVVDNAVSPTDTLNISAAGAATGTTGQASHQRYFAADLAGHCYRREITAAAGVVTAIDDGCD